MTPIISSSQRTCYLYFIVNLLIISLGADAGLITFFSKFQNDDKNPSTTSIKQQRMVEEKCEYEKIVEVTKLVDKDYQVKLQKNPSTPSLFFIGNCEDSSEVKEEEEEEEEEEEISEQELFNKAEIFIGNFYNQLKMQREESLKGSIRFASDLKVSI
ncbi:unnamed protein product [Withania somnifera]